LINKNKIKKMKNSAFIFLIFILMFSTVFHCNSQTNKKDGYVKFKIDAPQKMDMRESKFKVTDYKFPLKDIYIMEGSNSGFQIEFFENESEKNTLTLEFILPSGNTFQVYSKGNGYVVKSPDLPCTITNEDFKDIKSARAHRNVLAYIALIRNIRVASDESHVESVYFEIFSISISELSIKEGNLNFSGTFSGELSEKQKPFQDTEYKISGDFKITNSPVSIMMVDD
jgi:hypothetical protein